MPREIGWNGQVVARSACLSAVSAFIAYDRICICEQEFPDGSDARIAADLCQAEARLHDSTVQLLNIML